jgi:hypothetical protein
MILDHHLEAALAGHVSDGDSPVMLDKGVTIDKGID